MRAFWLTAVAVAALAGVLTAAQGQQGQAPADEAQLLSPEPLQPRSVQTQTFRPPVEPQREVEPARPQPAQKQAVRKRSRAATTDRAARRVSNVRRPLSQYAQARPAARVVAVREAMIVPTEAERARLSAGFDQYVTRMNIWSRPPWEVPATVGGTIPEWIQVYGVPSEIVAIHPAFAGNQFVVVGDDVVILEPGSRRIVAMLSRTTGAYVAQRAGPQPNAASTTGVAPPEDRIRLTRGQIASIRTVLRLRECRYRRPADFLIGDLVPGTAPFCDFPERVIAAVPEIEGYRFITRRNAVVVVDPASDRVVSVIR